MENQMDKKTPKKYNVNGPTKSVRAFSLDNSILEWIDIKADFKNMGRSQLVNEILTSVMKRDVDLIDT